MPERKDLPGEVTRIARDAVHVAIGLGVLDLLLGRERAGLLKRVALINAIWLATMTVVSLRYFFAFPTACLAAALLIFALAWLKLPGSSS